MTNVNEMITVREYAESLRQDGLAYQTSDLMTASDYAKALGLESSKNAVTSSLITVREYARALEEAKYIKAGDKEFEAQVEAYITNSRRAENNADILESLLA